MLKLLFDLVLLAAIVIVVIFSVYTGSVVAIFGTLLCAPLVFFFAAYKLIVLYMSRPTIQTNNYGGQNTRISVCPKCNAQNAILTIINKKDSLGIRQTYYACSGCGHIYVARTIEELKEQRIQQWVIIVACIILFGIAFWGIKKVDGVDGKYDYVGSIQNVHVSEKYYRCFAANNRDWC